MNIDNLHEIINRYEQNYAFVNNSANDELFKWKAVQCFQNEWKASRNAGLSFSQMFAKAIKESSVLINNRITHPANGIVKVAELEENEVKRLFLEVLFAEDGGDLNLRQERMDFFVESFNRLMAKHYPGSFKFKQDRHAASCYLALYKPERDYIYKYTHAENFARCIEFGKDIGSGESFSLANYYEMCDLVVDALQDHSGLIDAYESILTEDHYPDRSLHLLAFDIIYCASTYRLLEGLRYRSKKESIKAYTLLQLRQTEEAERTARIAELEQKLHVLDLQLDEYRNINLVGVQVWEKHNGVGIVVWQDVNKIRVQFGEKVLPYIIHPQFIWRPKFEDDAEIVDAMMDYERKTIEAKKIRKELEILKA